MGISAWIGKLRSSSTVNTMLVQMGDASCSIACDNKKVFDYLHSHFTNFLTDRPADVSIKLEIVNRMSAADLEAALPAVKFIHTGNCFQEESMMVTGEHDADAAAISVQLEKRLLGTETGRGLVNRALALLYYSACKMKHNSNPPAFIVHSSSIIHHGQVLLFAGPSESGKTTIGRMCNGYGEVLNDEAVLLSHPDPQSGVIRVQGLPIIGELPQRQNTVAPLRSVLLIKQSDRTALRRLDRVDAYLRFMRQIISPAYMGQDDRRAVYSLISSFSDEVTAAVPFYELEFTLDRQSLWLALDELEGSLERISS